MESSVFDVVVRGKAVVEGELWSGWADKDRIFRESYRQPNGTHICIEPSATVILCTSDNTPKDFPSNTEFTHLL
jgi:hypothetical protein